MIGKTNSGSGGVSTLINVSCSDFIGISVSCSKDSKTQSAMVPDSGLVTFKVKDLGTYTMSAVKNGRTFSTTITVSKLNYQYDMEFYALINVNLSIISAACDTVYYVKDGSNVTLCTTDANGIGSATLAIKPEGESYTIYSSIAKSTSSLSTPYSKTFTVTENTKNVQFMPAKALYWYGWKLHDWGTDIRIGGNTWVKNLTANTNSVSGYASLSNYTAAANGFDEPIDTTGYTKFKFVLDDAINSVTNTPNSAVYLGFGVNYGASSAYWKTTQLSTVKTFMAGTNVKATQSVQISSGSTHTWKAIWLEA